MLYPQQPPPWIWPFNGKILRGPLLYFWILLLMEVFSMYIWLLAPTFLTFDVLFWWLRVGDDIVFHWRFELFWLMVIIGYILHFYPLRLLIIVFLLIGIIFDGLVTSESSNSTPYFHEASQLVHPSRILPPYQRLVYFDHFDWLAFMWIVSYGFYHVSPHPPIKFQANILCFGWIWRLWLFDYLFSLILYFSTPNFMD